VIALAGFTQLIVQQLEQAVLRLAPTQALQQLGAEFRFLGLAGEGLVQVNRCELSGSLASPGARESVTMREIASFISLALVNNGMVLS
jgi:hypothetical protein